MAVAKSDDGSAISFKERLRLFYRGTLFQAIIVGLVSFTQPGIWSALSNLGAGGEAKPYYVNAANAVTFGVVIVFAPIFGIVANIIGVKWVLVIGTLGYAPYSAALYCNSVYGTQWFMILGAATCGLSASALWTSEAAVAVGYPEPHKRGLYVAVWVGINKLGGAIAGAIQLALNSGSDEKGSVSPQTYLVLLGIQCAGLPLALLLSPPEKVIRSDGSKIIFENPNRTLKTEVKALGRVFFRKEILLLLPIFISSGWGGTYSGNYLAGYFTVRARALLAFLVAVVGGIIDLTSGSLFDLQTWRRSLKAKYSWVVIASLWSAMWIWNLILQIHYDSKGSVDLDWSSPGFSAGAGVYMMFRLLTEVLVVWMYWILGTYDSNTDTLALTTGILRSMESVGNTFAFAIGSSSSTTLLTNLAISVAVFWASVPPSTWAAWIVPDIPNGELDEEESVHAEIVETTKTE